MGTQLFLLPFPTASFTSLPLLDLHINKPFNNKPLRCGSIGSPRTGARVRSKSFGRGDEDGLYSDDDHDHDGLGFGGAAKQRVWWSDYDYDDAWDFDEDDEFWGFKVFRAVGWMLPAIAISMVLGTGSNAFIMALAVPLGQSILSLVLDKVGRTTSDRWKSTPRTRTKKKPFRRAANDAKTSTGRKGENRTGRVEGSYQSWVDANGGSFNKDGKEAPKYGGWDQLDMQMRNPKKAPGEKAGGLPRQQKKGKLSRMGRVRETPLLMRLLIAIFPFLGSWTKFLF